MRSLAGYLIKKFLKFKNALGIKDKIGFYYLMQLDQYNQIHKNISISDKDTVESWALKHAKNLLLKTGAGAHQ